MGHGRKRWKKSMDGTMGCFRPPALQPDFVGDDFGNLVKICWLHSSEVPPVGSLDLCQATWCIVAAAALPVHRWPSNLRVTAAYCWCCHHYGHPYGLPDWISMVICWLQISPPCFHFVWENPVKMPSLCQSAVLRPCDPHSITQMPP